MLCKWEPWDIWPISSTNSLAIRHYKVSNVTPNSIRIPVVIYAALKPVLVWNIFFWATKTTSIFQTQKNVCSCQFSIYPWPSSPQQVLNSCQVTHNLWPNIVLFIRAVRLHLEWFQRGERKLDLTYYIEFKGLSVHGLNGAVIQNNSQFCKVSIEPSFNLQKYQWGNRMSQMYLLFSIPLQFSQQECVPCFDTVK